MKYLDFYLKLPKEINVNFNKDLSGEILVNDQISRLILDLLSVDTVDPSKNLTFPSTLLREAVSELESIRPGTILVPYLLLVKWAVGKELIIEPERIDRILSPEFAHNFNGLLIGYAEKCIGEVETSSEKSNMEKEEVKLSPAADLAEEIMDAILSLTKEHRNVRHFRFSSGVGILLDVLVPTGIEVSLSEIKGDRIYVKSTSDGSLIKMRWEYTVENSKVYADAAKKIDEQLIEFFAEDFIKEA